jgi:hypothetical protein
MQVTGDGLINVIGSTRRNEGIGGFYKGIVWAWGREGSYASIKLGAYAPVRDLLGAGKDCKIIFVVMIRRVWLHCMRQMDKEMPNVNE